MQEKAGETALQASLSDLAEVMLMPANSIVFVTRMALQANLSMWPTFWVIGINTTFYIRDIWPKLSHTFGLSVLVIRNIWAAHTLLEATKISQSASEAALPNISDKKGSYYQIFVIVGH